MSTDKEKLQKYEEDTEQEIKDEINELDNRKALTAQITCTSLLIISSMMIGYTAKLPTTTCLTKLTFTAFTSTIILTIISLIISKIKLDKDIKKYITKIKERDFKPEEKPYNEDALSRTGEYLSVLSIVTFLTGIITATITIILT